MTPALAVFWLLLAAGRPATPAGSEVRLLVFTRTTGFRHDSIPDGIAAIRGVAAESGLSVEATGTRRRSATRISPRIASSFSC
jgi:hypothetical protein